MKRKTIINIFIYLIFLWLFFLIINLLIYFFANVLFNYCLNILTILSNWIVILITFLSFNFIYFVSILICFKFKNNHSNLKQYPLSDLNSFKGGFILNLHLNFKKNNFKFHLLGQNHFLVVGSTGSGKTQSLVLPNILINLLSKAKPNLIIVDLKGEIFNTIKGYLKYFNYQYYLFDFVNFNFNHWNPLLLLNKYWKIKDFNHFEICLDNFLTILIKQVQSKSDPIWHFSAKIFLKVHFCYLLFNLKETLTLKIFVESFSIGYLKLIKQYKKYLKNQLNDDGFKIFKYNLAILLDNSNRMLPSIYLISLGALQKIATLKFLKMSLTNDLKLNVVKNFIVFLKIDPFIQTYWILATLFLDFTIMELINLKQKKLTLFFLDEFGNLPPINNFSSLISLGRGLNIYFFVILQSYDQLIQKYKNYINILANIDHHVFLHSNDLKTSATFSKKLGFKNKKQISVSKSKNNTSYNYSNKKELKLNEYDLTMLKKNQAIIKSRFKKTSFFKMKYFYKINNKIITTIITKQKR